MKTLTRRSLHNMRLVPLDTEGLFVECLNTMANYQKAEPRRQAWQYSTVLAAAKLDREVVLTSLANMVTNVAGLTVFDCNVLLITVRDLYELNLKDCFSQLTPKSKHSLVDGAMERAITRTRYYILCLIKQMVLKRHAFIIKSMNKELTN